MKIIFYFYISIKIIERNPSIDLTQPHTTQSERAPPDPLCIECLERPEPPRANESTFACSLLIWPTIIFNFINKYNFVLCKNKI